MEDKRIPKSENESIDNKIEDAIINEQNTLPYNPISKLPSLGTMIPLALAGETLAAQYKFKEDVPNIDEYLIEKLKYTSKVTLANALAAEQADAVAMAIYQFEKNKGLILADMAGIGKGRVNAAILRYAYVNGYLPIFITEKPNLFSAIYRDIKDIGGIAFKNDQPYFGKPLILNGYKSGGTEKTYDAKGKLIKIKKPSETGIIDRKTGLEIITAPEQADIKKIIKGNDIPKEFDMIFMTYSQLMEDKVEFLHRIMQNRGVIFSMDEVHNAAGAKSSVGVATQGLLAGAEGALYSSATFSKRPDNMYLYAIKTDVSESPLKTEELISVIKEGGERLTEFMAANIVASGQMLRREKTYDNCTVMYEYMSEADKNSSFEKYDTTLKYYRKIVDYFDVNKNLIYKDARNAAIQRFITKNKIKLASKRSKDQTPDDWKRANKGKYYISQFTLGDVTKSQFNFIESLLFSLKADFVSQQTLNQIQNNQLESVSTETKETFKSNRKPIIAVRNTLEGIYAALGYEVGDTIEKDDFSLYLLSFAKNGLSGVIAAKEVVEKGETAKVIKDAEFEILDSDFDDNGASYKELLKEIEEVDLNIPLSPIDRIINTIQSTNRESWDYKFNNSPNYVVGEVTGRKFRLAQQSDGKFKLELNTRDKNKASAFKKFNDGVYDVLLINESGSTGEDAHASRNFKDTRPRCMIIHQVELDVNTEVQKRGRINRTGMINYPTYIYAVSRIPSEIRRLLMLAKKMRSLDANTTANQKQSSKLSEIKDKFDNPIADIMNQYGDVVLQEFISTEEGAKFIPYMPDEEGDEGKIQKLSNQLAIEVFMRKLELANSQDQQDFYDSINPLYLDYVQKLKNEGTYDLETEIKDLKGSIKNRAVISRGTDTSPFNSSVYEEDNYVLAEDKPLDKAKIEDTIAMLAKGKRSDVFYNEFLEDFKKHYVEYQIPAAKDSVSLPDYTLARNEQERQEMRIQYETMVSMRLDNLKGEHDAILEILEILKPNLPCLIPANVDECYELDEDGYPVVPKEKNRGKFLGVKLLSAAKDKYSPMNIELIFAQLSGRSKVSFKPTKRGRQILEWIVVWLRKGLNIVELQEINNWYVDPNRREMMRLFTGDILSAYSIARDRINRDSSLYTRRIEFLKFTTADESAIRFGIRIFFRTRFVEIDPSRLPVLYPLNSQYLIDVLKNSQKYFEVFNEDNTFSLAKNSWAQRIIIMIFGGTYGKSPKDKSKAKYLSKLYDDAEFLQFCEDNDIEYDFYPYSYKAVDAKRSTTLNSKKFFFYVEEEESMNKLGIFLQKIYELDPFNISVQGESGAEGIKGRKDIYVVGAEGEEAEEVGTFKYHLLVPYQSIQSKLSGFSKFDSYDKGDRGNGTVILRKRATPIEANTFYLMPLESTAKNMINDTLSLFSDNERLNLNQEIKKMISDGDSNVEIGIFVSDKVIGRLSNAKNVFGIYHDDYDFIGQLFRDFEEGKIEEFKLPQKEVEDIDFEEVVEEVPLSYDSAQDFIITLISKIR